MGAWGTSLYSNDVALDVRSDYKDALSFGKTNETATAEIIEKYKDLFGTEDEALFWFAFADTQWNYGRLQLEVKQKALFFIENDTEDRWETKKDRSAWKETLRKLKEKLLSEQPPQKAIKLYHSFQCEWLLGDVFAYCFESEYSKTNGFYHNYVIFRKVSENHDWPDAVIPVVQVYKWIGNTIPSLQDISHYELLEMVYPPIHISDIKENRVYNLKLSINSKRSIPYKRLTYLGNIGGEDLIPYPGPHYYYSYYSVNWTARKPSLNFEHFVIDQYRRTIRTLP